MESPTPRLSKRQHREAEAQVDLLGDALEVAVQRARALQDHQARMRAWPGREGERASQHGALAREADVPLDDRQPGGVDGHAAGTDPGHPDREARRVRAESQLALNGRRVLPPRPVREGAAAHRSELAELLRLQVQPPAPVGHGERAAWLLVHPFQLRKGQRGWGGVLWCLAVVLRRVGARGQGKGAAQEREPTRCDIPGRYNHAAKLARIRASLRVGCRHGQECNGGRGLRGGGGGWWAVTLDRRRREPVRAAVLPRRR